MLRKKTLSVALAIMTAGLLSNQAKAQTVQPISTPTGKAWTRIALDLQKLQNEARTRNNSSREAYRVAGVYKRMASIQKNAAGMFASAAASTKVASHKAWFKYMENSCYIAARQNTWSADSMTRFADRLKSLGY